MFEAINQFARLASARSEVVAASMVLLMIVMMILPLDPAFLDVLIAVNISMAIVLVVSAVLLETPLAFSSFPAMLLMTTLFRLALTISTTRQILLEADAGNIIQTFGEFVVGGNVAVGLIIFLIISVVNFLVVTKGSERVAEVAARFSLDGMPGKQMSIDSDLRAGMISQMEAKKKRSMLEKESQLFGAMDGAIKFVKNDAIAGLIITLVNMVGGLAIGMMQMDMDFATAGSTYTILSVGDGLVGIIPSLLVSISAGLIVTRVTKGESDGANTAQDIIRDLSGNTKALQISAIFCMGFAFVPGMPSGAFIGMSAFLVVAWWRLQKRNDSEELPDSALQFSQLLEGKDKGTLTDVMETQAYHALEVRLPKSLDPQGNRVVRSICRIARNRVVEHLGILVPLFSFSETRKPEIECLVFGSPMCSFDPTDVRLNVRVHPDKLRKANIPFEETPNHLSGRRMVLVEPEYRAQLLQLELPFETHEEHWANTIEAVILRKITDLFTINEYSRHMTQNSATFGEQLKELDRVLPSLKVVEVFQRLLAENVSVRNLRYILNGLIEWGQRERDSLVITEQVRRYLSEQIVYQIGEKKSLRVFTVDPEFENIIRDATRHDGSVTFVDMDATTLSQISQQLANQVRPFVYSAESFAIVCSMDVRPYLRQIIQEELFFCPVLSHNEIPGSYALTVLAHLEFDNRMSPEFA